MGKFSTAYVIKKPFFPPKPQFHLIIWHYDNPKYSKFYIAL